MQLRSTQPGCNDFDLMHPELYFGIRAYAVFLALGNVVGWIAAIRCGRRAGLEVKRLGVCLLLLMFVALCGAKLYSLIERGGSLPTFWTEGFGGYRFPGAVIALLAALLLFRRRLPLGVPAALLADVIAPAFGLGMAAVRVGCLLAGCCSGVPSDLPWAIQFPRGSQPWHAHVAAGLLSPVAARSLPVHPLQLYFGLLSLGIAAFVLRLQAKKSYEGQLFLVYVALQGTGKFLLEFLRFGPLPHVQYASLFLGLGASVTLLLMAMRKDELKNVRGNSADTGAGPFLSSRNPATIRQP